MRLLVGSLLVCLALSGCLEASSSESFHPMSLGHRPVDGSPLEVLFQLTLDGEVEDLSWSLDADGDGLPDAGGTTLPAEVKHTFSAPGEYVARATVTGADFEQDIESTVQVVDIEPLVLQGTTDVISGPQKRDTGYMDCAGFLSGQDGLDCIWFRLDGLDGWTFQAESDGPPADVQFLTTCDATSTEALRMFPGNASGRVPDGSGCALLWAHGPATATMTLTLSPA